MRRSGSAVFSSPEPKVDRLKTFQMRREPDEAKLKENNILKTNQFLF